MLERGIDFEREMGVEMDDVAHYWMKLFSNIMEDEIIWSLWPKMITEMMEVGRRRW